MARKFGIELNSHGFCKVNPFNPMETSRPGILISGAFRGPVNIPELVVTASGAGSQCGELLSYRRGNLSKERIYSNCQKFYLKIPGRVHREVRDSSHGGWHSAGDHADCLGGWG